MIKSTKMVIMTTLNIDKSTGKTFTNSAYFWVKNYIFFNKSQPQFYQYQRYSILFCYVADIFYLKVSEYGSINEHIKSPKPPYHFQFKTEFATPVVHELLFERFYGSIHKHD